MTREEAIKRIKEWNLDDGTMEVLSAAIPELKESEDDRIKKAIVNHLLELSKSRVNLMTKATYENWIAWLEKQGEQKPKFRVGDTIKCKYDDRQFTIKSVDLDEGTYTYIQKGCGNDIDYADEEFELVEQEPAWSGEDKENISMLIDLVESKEESMEVKIELSAWLKSLKDRIQPQSKQEWSEEDEKILNSIIEDVMPCGECPDYPTDEEREYFYEGNRKVDWLKSLKNRITPTNKNDFDRGYDVGISAAQFNQWKPTEEQLEALEWSLGDYRNVIFEERHDTLTSLYNDLKKLKGEK